MLIRRILPRTSTLLKIATFLLIGRLHISVNVKNDKEIDKFQKYIYIFFFLILIWYFSITPSVFIFNTLH